MNPLDTGKKYNKIAEWWQDKHINSTYGVAQVRKALTFCAVRNKALDVGCGAGGRIIRLLEEARFLITGVDVSETMIGLAKNNHPRERFVARDICVWETGELFDFIVAWDSIFHLPLSRQKPVVKKLCRFLTPGGVLIYTFGDAVGEHTDTWRGDTFYYSSIGINNTLALLTGQGLKIMHLEQDQYPERHVFVIAKKNADSQTPRRIDNARPAP